MYLSRQSVELLAPVGTWRTLEAVIAAGCDAVYLGGKHFNMRMHRSDYNFSDTQLAAAVQYAHDHGVKIYITVNNLLTERELAPIRDYLSMLDELKPDGLIVQDLAVLALVRQMHLSLPLHASVMMNTHNTEMVKFLQSYGVTRVVAGREMTLEQLSRIKDATGIELEYFIHGDMCMSHSGQCLHSGIVFGQSANRGRCLKPCRWPYQLINADSGKAVNPDPGPYKLAVKDMCLFQHLPELIQAGVISFKVEGRMRTPDFLSRIIRTYRQAIDRYVSDPTGYQPDPAAWRELYENRARDFSTCYALGHPGYTLVGYSGEREPRFFSQAVKEAGLEVPVPGPLAAPGVKEPLRLTVRVADLDGVIAACQGGADTVYVGGDTFRPHRPWTLADIAQAVHTARRYGCHIVVATPRITMARELGELAETLPKLSDLQPAGVMVSNVGSLRLAETSTDLPLYADFSLNAANHLAGALLSQHRVAQITASLELPYHDAAAWAATTTVPLEIVVHGPLESMVLEHCVAAAVLHQGQADGLCRTACPVSRYALQDSAGAVHRLVADQYCRNHILFSRDLCLLSLVGSLAGAGFTRFRIEGQHYQPHTVAAVTAAYRRELDALQSDGAAYRFDPDRLTELAAHAPRPLGIGVMRYRCLA